MKKKLIGILAVASAAALLFGGAYLLTKDDIAQKNAEEELQPFMPSAEVQNALDYSEEDLNTEETTVTTTTTAGIEAGFAVETVNPETSVATQTTLPREVMEELMEQAQEMQETYPDGALRNYRVRKSSRKRHLRRFSKNSRSLPSPHGKKKSRRKTGADATSPKPSRHSLPRCGSPQSYTRNTGCRNSTTRTWKSSSMNLPTGNSCSATSTKTVTGTSSKIISASRCFKHLKVTKKNFSTGHVLPLGKTIFTHSIFVT